LLFFIVAGEEDLAKFRGHNKQFYARQGRAGRRAA
jgi:hypothetical protein